MVIIEEKNLGRFHYLLFGVIFGFCFPVVAAFIEIEFGGGHFISVLLGRTNRLLPIIYSAPIVLGIVFFWLGLKQERISELNLLKVRTDLERSQSLLETAEEVGRHGSWEYDIETSKSTWSRGLFSIFQISADQEAPDLSTFIERVLPSERELLLTALQDALLGKRQEFTVQYNFFLKDGSVRTMRSRGTVVFDIRQSPVKILGTVQDITELVMAQKEADFYKKAIDQSAIVAITNSAGIITHANENFCAISGFLRDELVGQTHRLINSGVMGSDFFKDMWQHIASGKIWRGEICNRAKEGHLYWVDSVIVPFIGPTGRPESYIAIRADISKRKLAEEQILLAHRRLEMAEGIGRIGSWECDEQYENFHCSKGFHSLLHLSEESKLSYSEFLNFVHPDDRLFLQDSQNKAIQSKQSFSCSFRVNLLSGEVRWLQADGQPIYREKMMLEKLLVSVRDITEQVQSDQFLIDAMAKAEQATKTKARFLANMSHEIRTPMNGIIGMTNLLLSGHQSEDDIEKLKIIQNCGNSLLDLINDILDFSKLEVDRLELEIEPFDLHNSVMEVVELLKTRASEKGISLNYFPGLDVPRWIQGDVTRLRQVVTNLVSNAIKFTEKGSVEIYSKVASKHGDLYLFQFSVKDTGVGIPDSVKHKLFQSFSQVDASTTRKYGGTGLGLAITKGICEKMGGTVSVESQVGQGATFTFTFRAKISEAVQSLHYKDPFAFTDAPIGIKKELNILVAEDNKINQMVMIGFLEKLGYQADVVEDGLKVLKSLEKKVYDLILMDCHMPVMDGFEAARRVIASCSSGHRPRIIAVTASLMQEDVKKCVDSGMDGVIEKPVSIESLQKVLVDCPQHLLRKI